MSITITVPNDDHVALRAMAKALEEIAVARGAPSKSEQIVELNIDTTQATAALKELMEQVESDTTTQQVESLSGRFATPEELEKIDETLRNVGVDENTPVESVLMAESPTTDSTGTPWDERIHSASKALNADGTWRVRRKPKDMDEAEWSDYVDMIKADLQHPVECGGQEPADREQEALDAIRKATDDLSKGVPVAEDVAPLAQSEPPVTPAGDDFHVDAGEVTEQQIASIPAPPLPVSGLVCQCKSELSGHHTRMCPEFKDSSMTVKISETEPVALMTFPQVMQFLTERHGRITSAQVDDIIADMGLNSIMDLNTQPEHTGPFIARVKALLGE